MAAAVTARTWWPSRPTEAPHAPPAHRPPGSETFKFTEKEHTS